jgi:hypothetical protein
MISDKRFDFDMAKTSIVQYILLLPAKQICFSFAHFLYPLLFALEETFIHI